MEGELAFELCDPLGLLGDLFAESFILLLQSLNLFRLVGQRLLITRSSVRRPLWPPPRHPGYDSDSRGFCPAPVNCYLPAATRTGGTGGPRHVPIARRQSVAEADDAPPTRQAPRPLRSPSRHRLDHGASSPGTTALRWIPNFSPNTVHLTFLDANSHVHDARAAAPTRPEWKLAHLTLHPPGHTAPATRYDPIPGVRQLGQQGLMEGWPVPRGE